MRVSAAVRRSGVEVELYLAPVSVLRIVVVVVSSAWAWVSRPGFPSRIRRTMETTVFRDGLTTKTIAYYGAK